LAVNNSTAKNEHVVEQQEGAPQKVDETNL